MVGFYHLTTRARILLLAVAVVFFTVSSVIYVNAYHRLKPIYEVVTKEKVIALTFDISWGNQTPEPVINILKEHDIRSTFFSLVPGPNSTRKYPGVSRRTGTRSPVMVIDT